MLSDVVLAAAEVLGAEELASVVELRASEELGADVLVGATEVLAAVEAALELSVAFCLFANATMVEAKSSSSVARASIASLSSR